jgi:hypothetical protein
MIDINQNTMSNSKIACKLYTLQDHPVKMGIREFLSWSKELGISHMNISQLGRAHECYEKLVDHFENS